MRAMRIAGVVALALALAACGGNDEAADVADGGDQAAISPGGGGAAAMGPGLSVEEAQASELDGPLLVRGYLVLAEGEPARLCTNLMESFPPQCGGPSLEVVGLDPAEHELSSEGGTSWSEQEVKLLGQVQDGTITLEGGSASA